MQCLCCVSLQHAAIILCAVTPLNSNYKHCLCHFQWVTVDAVVLVLCVSPTSRNMQTLCSINSNIYKHCLFHFQWVTAVNAVLVLRVSAARDNTKCRHSTHQTLFVPLSMNLSALGISISTINPNHYSFFINSPSFGITYHQYFTNNQPQTVLRCALALFFFNLHYLT